jgi:hypothetical protein
MRRGTLDGRFALMRAAAAGAAVTALLAGCGSAVSPAAATGSAGGAGSHPAGLTSPLAGGLSPLGGSRAQAMALARSLLSRLILPQGTRPVGKGAGPRAAGPFTMVNDRRTFSLSMAMTPAYRFFLHHAPAGTRALSNGRSSGPGGVMDREAGFFLRKLPAGIYSAEADLAISPAPGGGSVLHADAEVVWSPRRSAAERVNPEHFAVVTVTARQYLRPERTVIRRITAPVVIARLARMLNAMPAAPIVAMPCPATLATYRVAFTAVGGGPPALVASTGSCGDVSVAAGGRQQPALADSGGRLAAAVRHLAGLPPLR